MKIKYKPKQSTNNSTKRIIRDSNPKAIVGTLVGFMTTHTSVFVLLLVSLLTLTFIVSDNTVFAASYEYSIKYNDNVVDNMPMDVNDGRAVGGSLSLSSNTPVRSGYKFLGWCNTLPTTTDGTDSCSGTTYQPSAGITIASAANFHFYAMWGELCAGYTAMQNLSSSTLATLLPNIGSNADVCDVRDGEIYKIAKLADNKYWMLDNLRLDPTSVDLATLQGNTNASDTTLGYLKNGGGTSPYPSTGIVAKTASGGSWSNNSYNLPYIATSGTDYGGWDKNTEASAKYGVGSSKIGVYYNYCAASAGSWCYASNQPSSDPDTSTLIDVKEDLCPAGWRMPTSTANGEYQALLTAYNDNKTATDSGSLQYNLSTPLSGFFYNSLRFNFGSVGGFWSSTYRNGASMYRLRVNASNVNPSDYDTRSYGDSLRCIAK